jgi:hypothetical protein
MKWIFFIPLLASAITSCNVGCNGNNRYEVREDKVFFIGCAGFIGISSYTHELTEADAQSFVALQPTDGYIFGKDKNHVYVTSYVLSSVDPNSFEYLGNGFCADQDSIYYFMDILNDVLSLPDADRSSFKIDPIAPWARDDARAFWQDKHIEVSDIKTFTVVSRNWAKDSSHYFYRGQRLDSIDYGSFRIINELEARDKTHLYKYGKIHDQ